ncbi:MAG: arsenic resistance protein [Clostridiales bacterium]|nr:arsenic resistance protein [Clostridiales bacterium]
MFFKKNLMKLVPLTIVVALLIGYATDTSLLKGFVTYVLFLMIYPMMINLNTLDVFKTFQNPKKIIIATVINFVVAPVTAIILSKIFFSNYPSLAFGMLVISVLPTSGMTASWTGLSGGNLKLSLAIMSSNLLLSIVFLPFYLSILNNTGMTVETSVIVGSLIKVVVLPLLLGDATRRLILKLKGPSGYKKAKPYFGEISSFFVLIIIFIAVSLKSKMILSNPTLALYAMVPMTIFYITIMSISHLLGKRFDKADQIALVFSTTMRNLTIALGIVMGIEGGSLAVFLMALSYMVQLPIATFYHHLSVKRLAQTS